jgi:RNA polymerase sigma factor (TIGR02999 family)
MEDVTQILHRIDQGDRSAIDQLLPEVYEELRKIARGRMAGERKDHTLQPTALVSEAYLRLVNPQSPLQWESRRHFFAAAAEAMRRILIEHARERLRQKRGGDRARADIDAATIADTEPARLLEFDEVLSKLAAFDARKAELVKLKCFAGLDREALSNALGISLTTVDRDWAFAKVWLFRELNTSNANPIRKTD